MGPHLEYRASQSSLQVMRRVETSSSRGSQDTQGRHHQERMHRIYEKQRDILGKWQGSLARLERNCGR
jgi:hypothetical protein